ncbi:MAG: two-component system, response regulator PdtaR [Clostridia bacterium]|nr:two-component system, response regulator PdtaR [Clostridia bacterium]
MAAVLLLTAYGDSEIIKKAIDAGVVGYLTKPFSESDLSPAIQITWERYKEFMKLKKQKVNLKEKIEEDKRIQKSYNRC